MIQVSYIFYYLNIINMIIVFYFQTIISTFGWAIFQKWFIPLIYDTKLINFEKIRHF